MSKSLPIAAASLWLLVSGLCAQDPGKQLRKAISADDAATVAALVGSKAAVNSSNADGVTPLMIAAALGNVKIVTSLIAAGAQVEKQTTKDALTALIFAADFNHLDVVQVLVAGGASVKATDKQGYSAIDYAIIPNKEDVAEMRRDEAKKKILDDHAKAIIEYLTSKGAEPKKGNPGSGADVGGIVGNILAVGLQADLKKLVEAAREER